MGTKHDAIVGLVDSAVNRRQFGRRVLTAGAIVTGAAAVLSLDQADAIAQSLSDVDILNFALNLEYLEAEFYTVATYGTRIADAGIGIDGTGRPGATVGGSAVALTNFNRIAAEHITLDEQQHVLFLRAALGSAAIAKPSINLQALGIGFANQNEFLTLARAFEDLGVSAYGGAAPLIKSADILAPAARIALTEAQHAGVLRMLVAMAGIAVPMTDGADVPPLGSPAGRLFQVQGDGLSTVRSASQVLAAAFAGSAAGTRSGGFFPDGVNGVIDRV